MSDARRPSQVITLHDARDLVPLSRDEIRRFAAIKKRKTLLKSKAYLELGPKMGALTYALVYRPARVPPPRIERDFVRVATWNIERGIQLDGILTYLRNHEVLRGADVLLLNEVDRGMARSGNRDVAAEIADALGLHMVYGNSYLCLDHGDTRDGTHAQPNRESLHGNAILSRHPIRRAENFTIAVSKEKFHSSDRRLGHKKSMWAEIDTPFGLLPVVSVHLDVICSVWERLAQLTDILNKIDDRGLRDRVLLGGDFNTSTYDVHSIPRLGWNLLKKLVRGGVPHAMAHYMRPFEIYEKPLFDALEAAEIEWRAYNDLAYETSRYEVGDFESESKVRDFLPQFAVDFLRRKLEPWDGVAPLKLDWFCGRGLTVLQSDGDPSAETRPASLGPRAFARPQHNGHSLTDHDPLLVDVVFSTDAVPPKEPNP